MIIYLIFVQHMKQNTYNAKMLEIWFDDKLREVYAKNDLIVVRS